jgi:heme exporter protein A
MQLRPRDYSGDDVRLLTASGLGILRGERVLFDAVSLEVAPGEAVVLRGANGAGKTTLLRVLAGLTRAETGEVIRTAPHHWVGHREGMKPHETPRAHLDLWARAWGADADVGAILNEMGLSRPAGVAARYLSAGQRRRTALARVLLDKRPVWLLDEPFTALDAEGRTRVLDMVAEHRQGGGAVVAAVHGEVGFAASREITL